MCVTGNTCVSMAVTMPKFPLVPRTAKNSSGSVSAVTLRARPSAVTISRALTYSEAQPSERPRNGLWPPPSMNPVAPTVGDEPIMGASPDGVTASSTSCHRAPPPKRTCRASTSTLTVRIRLVLTTTISSSWSATMCPPPRTATPRPLSAAKRIAA